MKALKRVIIEYNFSGIRNISSCRVGKTCSYSPIESLNPPIKRLVSLNLKGFENQISYWDARHVAPVKAVRVHQKLVVLLVVSSPNTAEVRFARHIPIGAAPPHRDEADREANFGLTCVTGDVVLVAIRSSLIELPHLQSF